MSWVKNNRAALGALALLVPLTLIAVAGNEWRDYYWSRPVLPVSVNAAGVGELAGATFGEARADVSDARDMLGPEGALVATVTVDVTPDPNTGVSCFEPTLRDEVRGWEWSEAQGRIWVAADSSAGSLPSSCLGDEVREPYQLTLHYLLPAEASGDFTVQVSTAETMPRVLRLPVKLEWPTP